MTFGKLSILIQTLITLERYNMKKILLILILSIFLVGCTNTYKLESNMYESNIIVIDNEELLEMEKDKNFILLVSQVGCSLSNDFDEVVTNISNEKDITIYKVMFSNIEGTKLSKKIKYYPSLVIYKDGNIKDYLKSNKEKDLDYYKSKDKLIKRIEKRIILK